MKTYVYGYDIKNDYDEKPRTIGSGDRYVVVVHEPLTEEEVIHKVLYRITTASCCKHNKSLKERIEIARKMFEITNVKLVREYGK
jgi:hypothetical protein